MAASRTEQTIAALCDTVIRGRCAAPEAQIAERGEEVRRFVLGQLGAMPDHVRWGFYLLTLVFDATGWLHAGTSFRRAGHEARWRQIAAWRGLPIVREFIRFYETMTVYSWYGHAGA